MSGVSVAELTTLIADTVVICTWCNFMKIFFTKVKNKFLLILNYVLYLVSLNLIRTYVNIPIVLIVVNILFIFLITCNYKAKLQLKITATIYLYAISMLVETIIAIVANIMDSELLLSNTEYSAAYLLSCVCTFFLVMFLKNMNMLKNGTDIPLKLWLAICIIPISSVALSFYLFTCGHCSYEAALVSSIFVFGINITVFDLYDSLVKQFNQTIRLKVIQQQNMYYESQLETMLKNHENISRYRHDNKTRILVLQTLLTNGKADRALEYLSEMNQAYDMNFSRVHTGNHGIDAVINFKLEKSEENNIKLITNLQIPEGIDIDDMDIAVVLGNLLDNAITATELCEKEREIHMAMNYDRSILHIEISNPYIGTIKSRNGRYYTTKKDSAEHGFGIATVKRIIELYDGIMEINYENYIFYVNILMYIPKKC